MATKKAKKRRPKAIKAVKGKRYGATQAGSSKAVKTKYGVKYVNAEGKRVKSSTYKPLTLKQKQALRKAQQASARKRKGKKKKRKIYARAGAAAVRKRR